MGAHLIDGEFQSDKYPTTPRGKVPLSVKDPTAQDLLWTCAQRRRSVDAEFSDDLEQALINAGGVPASARRGKLRAACEAALAYLERQENAIFPLTTGGGGGGGGSAGSTASTDRRVLLGVLRAVLSETP